MRLPRLRFTVRRMMVTVAIVAGLIAIATHLQKVDRQRVLPLIRSHERESRTQRILAARLSRMAEQEQDAERATTLKSEATFHLNRAIDFETSADKYAHLYGLQSYREK